MIHTSRFFHVYMNIYFNNDSYQIGIISSSNQIFTNEDTPLSYVSLKKEENFVNLTLTYCTTTLIILPCAFFILLYLLSAQEGWSVWTMSMASPSLSSIRTWPVEKPCGRSEGRRGVRKKGLFT